MQESHGRGSRALLILALAVALPAAAEDASDTMGPAVQRQPFLRAPLTTIGQQSWSTGTTDTATIDCLASGYDGATTWQCGGTLAPTFTLVSSSGALTAPVTNTPFAYDGSTNLQAIRMNTTNNTHAFNAASSVFNRPGAFSVCALFDSHDGGGSAAIVCNGLNVGNASTKEWCMDTANGKCTFSVYKNVINDLVQSGATVSSDTYNVCCASFDNGTDGSAVLLVNMNGNASSYTTAHTPLTPTTGSQAVIGANWNGAAISNPLRGGVARVTLWDTAFTAAQLQQMVAGMMGIVDGGNHQLSFVRQGKKPCLVNGVIYDMGGTSGVNAGIPCVNENGLALNGATYTSRVQQSEAFDSGSWTNIGTNPTVTANSTADPDDDGVVEADTITDNSATEAQGRKQSTGCGNTNGTFTACVYMKAGTLSTGTLRIASNGTGTTSLEQALTSTLTRYCLTTTTTGATTVDIEIYPGRQSVVGDTGSIIAWQADCTNTGASRWPMRTLATTYALPASESLKVNNPFLENRGAACLDVMATYSDYATPSGGWATMFEMNPSILRLTAATTIKLFDGTNTTTGATIASIVGNYPTVCGLWDNASAKMATFQTGATMEALQTYDRTFGTTATTAVDVGGFSSTTNGEITIRNVCMTKGFNTDGTTPNLVGFCP